MIGGEFRRKRDGRNSFVDAVFLRTLACGLCLPEVLLSRAWVFASLNILSRVPYETARCDG